jgi:MFS family permease
LSRIFYGWIVVTAIGIGLVISQGTSGFLFSLVLLPMESDLGWSRAQLSGAYSLSLLVLGLVGIPIGVMSDRRGPRFLIMAGSVLAAASLLGIAAATELWQLYLFWGLALGLATGLNSQLVGSTTIANWFIRRRGTAIALLTSIVGLSAPIYVPLVGWLVFHVGWRTALGFVALGFLLIPLPLAMLVRRRPEDMGLMPDGQGRAEVKVPVLSGYSLQEAMARQAFWMIGLGSVLSSLAWGAVNAHQIAFMVGRRFDPLLAASVVGTVGLLSVPGRFLFNAASDWIGPRRLIIVVAGLQAAGIGILTEAVSATWLVAYSIIYGSAAGAMFGLRSTLLAHLFGRKAYGAISGVHQAFIYVSSAVGPFAAGLMYDHFHDYRLAFSVATMMTAAAVVALLFVPSTDLELGSRLAPRHAG